MSNRSCYAYVVRRLCAHNMRPKTIKAAAKLNLYLAGRVKTTLSKMAFDEGISMSALVSRLTHGEAIRRLPKISTPIA